LVAQRSRVLSPWGLSLVVSLAAAAVAVVWLAAPDTYPYGSGDNVRTGRALPADLDIVIRAVRTGVPRRMTGRRAPTRTGPGTAPGSTDIEYVGGHDLRPHPQ